MALFRNLSSGVQALVYGRSLYRLWLDRNRDAFVQRNWPVDPWPGDAQAGRALIGFSNDPFAACALALGSDQQERLAHNWLRDLRAVNAPEAKQRAFALLDLWMDRYDRWRPASWSPDVLGERIANWIGFYDFFATQAPPAWQNRLIASLLRQGRHLRKTFPSETKGYAGLNALRGLMALGLCQKAPEAVFAQATWALRRQIALEVLPDGGHVSRNPLEQLRVLRGLIDLRALSSAAGLNVLPELSQAVERMALALKFFRHGDGSLGLFNGAHEVLTAEIDSVLNAAGARGKIPKRLANTGYERMASGRSLLIADVGRPALAPYDALAHAGLLAFEFSSGRERLIVNCGSGPEDDLAWRNALAATAAHNTLTLNDTNACELLQGGGIGQRPDNAKSQRFDRQGESLLEASHDGYAPMFRAVHRRTLRLCAEGEELHGRDVVEGPCGHMFALRWHLHPQVRASIGQGGQTALLRLPSGNGWRFRLDAGALSLEPSVYYGGQAPERTLHLKAVGPTHDGSTEMNWLLAREKKG